MRIPKFSSTLPRYLYRFTASLLLSLLTITPYFLALASNTDASIYNRSPWPAEFKGLTFEKDNTDSEEAAHPCSRTSGRSFKVTHPESFKLSGLVVYVFVPNRQESRFSKDLLRLSFLDPSNQKLLTNLSPSYSAVISRDGSAQPTFEVYFPLNLNVAGGLTYTAQLACLTDDNLLRVEESSQISDGEAAYYNSVSDQTTPYYLPGRKVLFTSLSELFGPHFPSFAKATEGEAALNGGPPKFHPVIFIHGLGGSPGAFDGTEDQSRNYVKLLTDLGYPTDYIYLYSYGYKEDGKGNRYYNYQGDVREIAQGMEVIVNSLSERHQKQGGDGRVDIVAHSLGNLVTRQYLLTHQDNHKIRRYVAVGAPFKGAWVMGVDKKVELLPGIGKRVETALADAVLKIHNKNNPSPLNRGSAALIQVTPNSDFLEGYGGINRTKIDNLEFYAIYGDINASVRQKIFSKEFELKLNVGDGLILADSATYHDWLVSEPKLYAYNDGMIVDLKFDRENKIWAAELRVSDPKSLKTLHTALLSRQDSKSKIICLVSSESTQDCQ